MINVKDEYFEWLCNLVCDERSSVSHKRLLWNLYIKPFTWVIPRDSNRAADGARLVTRFIEETGLYVETEYCSILEMMVALSVIIENNIMADEDFGDRTGEWFWSMILSLGLQNLTDNNWDQTYYDDVIFKFLSRTYEPNGKGGLFTVNNGTDMRNIEIWYQLQYSLNELMDI